jgi:hypothetical protein
VFRGGQYFSWPSCHKHRFSDVELVRQKEAFM